MIILIDGKGALYSINRNAKGTDTRLEMNDGFCIEDALDSGGQANDQVGKIAIPFLTVNRDSTQDGKI
ncbi:MAG: hypothetical protein M1469_02020 [Bacteroidetes bacterium]|nr:hypothetical protein [Bacteroidota bacterium]